MRRGSEGRERSGSLQVTMYPVNTPSMVFVDHWPSDVDVAGAFVKFAPKINRDDRDAVDLAGVADELRARGAIAVVLAPVVTSAMGKRESRRTRKALSADECVTRWLARNVALTDADRAVVSEYLAGVLALEGI